jgi:hypothetical protein
MLTISLATILLGFSGEVAGVTQEEPPAWGGSVGAARVTVEVEAEQLPDRVRFTYTVRNLTEPIDGRWPAIGSILIGGPADSVRSELTSPPIAVESPPGWEARLFADDRTTPRTWRLQWWCAQGGWEHNLRYQIKAGTALSGFRVTARSGESAYLTATYSVGLDLQHGIGTNSPLGLMGRPIVKRPRPSK